MKRLFKHLELRFSPFGALIVSAQALPNILWVLFPPETNRLAGNVSSVAFIEYGEHVLGVAIVILLLLLRNRERPETLPRGASSLAAYVAIALYWVCWALYFAGVQANPVLYLMVVLPPVAFFLAGVAQRVWPISAASVVFLVFHLLVALENYPVFGQVN